MLNLADLEARVARLESRNYVSMRYGRVTGTKDGEAQIQLNDADELNTNSYQTLQRRVLRDQEIKLPDIGDTALVLESGQGEEQGAYLGAPYSQAVPGTGQEQQVAYSKYEDGTELWYDRKAHKLTAKVKGDASIEAKGTASVTSETGIKLRAPFIELAGTVIMTDEDGNPGSALVSGTITVRDGGIKAPDDDISAGSVSLRHHTHPDTGEPVGG